MTNKPLKKLAVIRTEKGRPCPFGLSITEGCRVVGNAIHQMIPVEQGGNPESNQDILLWYGSGQRCPFAKEIMDEKEAVQCSFVAVDNETHLPTGSAYHTKPFSTTTLQGLFSEPQGYYNPQSTDRGMYYGQYSVEGQSKEKKK